MTHVATFISNPAAAVLDAAVLARARDVLPAPGPAEWLDPAIAADIRFTLEQLSDTSALAERLRTMFEELPIDVVVQALAHRRKRLLVADMDSTMIGQECIDELADFAGLKADVAAITERAMRGEIEFEPALRQRVGLLRGLPASIIEDVIAQRVRVTPGARTLVATMRAHGAYACLVSGGFTVFTQRVAAMLGFDESRGNTLLIDEAGKLTGAVAEPVLGRDAKLATLVALRDGLGLQPAQTLAVGDGANDLAMITQAGLGVAYHAKPAVARAAAVRINHGDLTALLYLQGYRRHEFSG